VIKVNWSARQLILCLTAGVCLTLCGGCNIIGLLANPGAYEQKLKPGYDLKPQSKRRILVWVDPSPGSGAGAKEAGMLTTSLVAQLTGKVGVSKKDVVIQLNSEALSRDISARPETLAAQAGAELAFYVHIESFQATNLHSNTIYTGNMLSRGVLLDVKNGQTLWPQQGGGMVVDVSIDTTSKGRDDLVEQLCKASAHCLVRDLYACPKTEYKINQERSALNEMIQQEVY
jgi:hypothetical protein